MEEPIIVEVKSILDDPDVDDEMREKLEKMQSRRAQEFETAGAEPMKIVNFKYMQQVCNDMSEAQAIDLIQGAVVEYYKENKEEADVEEMLLHIRQVNHKTRDLKRGLKLAKSNEGDQQSGKVLAPHSDLYSHASQPQSFMQELCMPCGVETCAHQRRP